MENLKKYITETKNFPKPGIEFKDINPIYKNPNLWSQSMSSLEEFIKRKRPDYIAGVESRGFIIGSALAYKLNIGFIPIRKPNKLPGDVIGIDYVLEYGSDRLEIQKELIDVGASFILIDDLLATGGTAFTAGKLIRKTGAKLIGYGFLAELTTLKGRKLLDQNLCIESVIKY